MKRRLVLVIAVAVAAAILVVGLGTLVLTRLDTQHRNEDELARRTAALAGVVAEVRPARVRPTARRLQPALDVEAVVVFALDEPPGWLGPEGVARLRTGQTVSTREDSTTYAAAPILRDGETAPRRGVMAVDSVGADFGVAGRWFVLTGALTVIVGVGVALALARSLARPLSAAEAATRRIASGDLAARVPESHRDDELARLARSINEMAASLERSQATEREFLLSVSHDLRTPLTSIAGWAEALSDGNAPDTAAAGRTILGESRRLDRLVRDLLDLARLRARSFTLDLRTVDLRDIASGTAEGLRPDLEDAGLAVGVDVGPDPVSVRGDADRLAQIAANLIENAGRHATSSVRVGVAADGDDALLWVADDGPGIPADDRVQVFERLHGTVRPAARPGQGTGLGLAIVQELTRAMGGHATVTDADGAGARVVVRLPALPD